MKHFPLDIKAARKYGINKWREGFFWPISYKSFLEVERKIKGALNSLINKNKDNDMGDLLVINYKIFFEYSNLLNALRVLKELNQKGLKPLYSNDSVLFKGIIEKGVPVRSVLPIPFIPRKTILENAKKQYRLVKGAFKFNGSNTSSWKLLFSGGPYIAHYPSLNSLAREYIALKMAGCVRLKDASGWYDQSFSLQNNEREEEEIRSLVKEMISTIEKIALDYGIELEEIQRAYLKKVTLELLLETFICFRSLNSYVSSLKPMNLLIGCGGNHFSRMLSLAVLKHGGSVSGFAHGGPLVYKWDKYSWLELSTVNRFITYTEHSARTMASLLETYPPLKENTLKIEGAETGMFRNIWQRESKKLLPEKIERVMIVANCFVYDNMLGQGIAFPELMQLDWELRTVNILKKAGYKVIYKNHPDGKLCGLTIDFLDSDVEIIYDRFEDVMEYADAFLFFHTRSTTLGPALCSNKPIIYIDGGWEIWLPEMRELFSKRCTIVSAHFDERNRLIINEEELLNALVCKPAEPNTEFIEKYMFPDGVKV